MKDVLLAGVRKAFLLKLFFLLYIKNIKLNIVITSERRKRRKKHCELEVKKIGMLFAFLSPHSAFTATSFGGVCCWKLGIGELSPEVASLQYQ